MIRPGDPRLVRDDELVRVRLTRPHRRLRNERHAVHLIRRLDAVEVNRRRLAQLVLEHNAHAITFTYANLRSRHLIVVSHRRNALPWRDLPLHLTRCKIEDLHALVHARRQELIALPGRLRREGFHGCLVHLVHRICLGARIDYWSHRRGGAGVSHRAVGRGHRACGALRFLARR